VKTQLIHIMSYAKIAQSFVLACGHSTPRFGEILASYFIFWTAHFSVSTPHK